MLRNRHTHLSHHVGGDADLLCGSLHVGYHAEDTDGAGEGGWVAHNPVGLQAM